MNPVARAVETFFIWIEEIWAVIPAPVKIFIYSVTSVIVGMYIDQNAIDWNQLAYIVATNLGLYSGTRAVASKTRQVMGTSKK